MNTGCVLAILGTGDQSDGGPKPVIAFVSSSDSASVTSDMPHVGMETSQQKGVLNAARPLQSQT